MPAVEVIGWQQPAVSIHAVNRPPVGATSPSLQLEPTRQLRMPRLPIVACRRVIFPAEEFNSHLLPPDTGNKLHPSRKGGTRKDGAATLAAARPQK